MHYHLIIKKKVSPKQQLILRQFIRLPSIIGHTLFSKVFCCIPYRTNLEIEEYELTSILQQMYPTILRVDLIKPQIIIVVYVTVQIELKLRVINISRLYWPIVKYVVSKLNTLSQIIESEVYQV